MYHTLHACVHDQLCLTPCDPLDCTHQTPLFMEFSRQEHWGRQPFPTPGDFPHPGIKLSSPTSPVLQANSLPLSHQGSPYHTFILQFPIDIMVPLELLYHFSNSFTLPNVGESSNWFPNSVFLRQEHIIWTFSKQTLVCCFCSCLCPL